MISRYKITARSDGSREVFRRKPGFLLTVLVLVVISMGLVLIPIAFILAIAYFCDIDGLWSWFLGWRLDSIQHCESAASSRLASLRECDRLRDRYYS